MPDFRERLLDRMILIYGFENPITIDFCRLCEEYLGNTKYDMLLEAIVKLHEERPVLFD